MKLIERKLENKIMINKYYSDIPLEVCIIN